jgi:hypothetical protein
MGPFHPIELFSLFLGFGFFLSLDGQGVSRELHKAVSQGRLTVIYVGYDAEITYMLHGGESTTQNQL